jgi:hypothetical protein
MKWANNMLSTVENYYLVIYTDESDLLELLSIRENPKIKIVIKQVEEFVTYKYREQWIENHERNDLLNGKGRVSVDWRVNMLWSEKTFFVANTKKEEYFPATDFYGWCDIGYFRDGPIRNWPNLAKIKTLNPNKIHYAYIKEGLSYLSHLIRLINNKREDGLPLVEIPPHQVSIAGGFFIAPAGKVDDWCHIYDTRLSAYFGAGYLVKDDQIILADLIFSNISEFVLHRENISGLDDWFMFQRHLL